ncbi:MAG TPA: histidine kinase dimerization/phospho-acceptor domain-containing protein [Vicinamibacterales bacterium]|nr:histidine kinase dimerization/phospho-acceptor domain-containing protein [Vicinamibacterales bacterium]
MNHDELGRLLSLVSHEVRAPLGVMRGYLRLLEQQGTELSEQHRHAVTAALKASERAADLLGQVSALAGLQRGDVATALKPTPLEPLLRSAVHAVSMPPEPIVTVHVGDPPAVMVAADEELLRVAFAGLTSAVVRAQAADCRVFLLTRVDARNQRPGVTLTIVTTETESGAAEEVPLDVMRSGLGLDLPIAAYVIAAHHGWVCERREQDRFAGISAWVPLS